MTIREAIRAQQESIKNRTSKEQFSYFWEYYGIKAVCLILAVTVVIAFIVSIATQKEYGFTGVFFGAEPQSAAESYLADFAQAAMIDPKEYELTVQSSLDIRMDQQITTEIYQSMQTFAAMVASNSVDCFAGSIDLFLYYGYLGYATDLRTVLTTEELNDLAPYLHYIDGKLIEEQENANEGLSFAYSQSPDSTQPEIMRDPIPVAVALTAATEEFLENYRFPGADTVIGICASSEHPDNAAAFLRYCLGLPMTP